MIIEENEHVKVENHDGYVEEEDEEIPSGDLSDSEVFGKSS
jgi:hypothetical protein